MLGEAFISLIGEQRYFRPTVKLCNSIPLVFTVFLCIVFLFLYELVYTSSELLMSRFLLEG
jgi:hypothetical protein